jgi:hypothetical protein
LRNLGSILWDVGRRDEAIAACEEAVGIMRKLVNPETYFLPALAEALDQLADYLAEKRDVGGASAAAAECAEVRREFAVLPPEPEFLFEKVLDMVELDDEWEFPIPAVESHESDDEADESDDEADESDGEADESDSEADESDSEADESDDELDEYHDASEPLMSIEPPAFILELSGPSSTPPPGSSIGIDAPIQSKPCGMSIATESSDIVVLDGSSAVESLAATDTVKGIFTKPLEVDMRLNMHMRLRSTLMDVVWWVLLGISFAIAWRRVA